MIRCQTKVLLYWLQVSVQPDCKNLGSGVPSLMAADKPFPQLQPSLLTTIYDKFWVPLKVIEALVPLNIYLTFTAFTFGYLENLDYFKAEFSVKPLRNYCTVDCSKHIVVLFPPQSTWFLWNKTRYGKILFEGAFFFSK